MSTLFSPSIEDYYDKEDRGYVTPCWVWRLGLDGDGYGKIKRERRTYRAHRWFFEQQFGFVPPLLDHLCRVRSCVNPFHLEPVSNSENIRRGLPAKLSMEDVVFIREELRDEIGVRVRSGRSKELCERFGVSPSQMSRIKNLQRWTGN